MLLVLDLRNLLGIVGSELYHIFSSASSATSSSSILLTTYHIMLILGFILDYVYPLVGITSKVILGVNLSSMDWTFHIPN